MRIRKHAKVSPLLYYAAAGSPVVQTATVCELNQSPWDVITFTHHQQQQHPDNNDYSFAAATYPPLNHQVEEEDSFLGNGSFCASIGASESVASMKLSFDDDKETWAYPDDNGAIIGGAVDVEMNELKTEMPSEVVVEGVEEEEELFCSKIDAKGWQCHRIAKSGHTFCEHHESLEHSRRGRPKKGSTSTDPNGYYYYSGFGPRWGKRRGQSNSCNNNDGSEGNDEPNISETPKLYGESDYMVEENEDEDEDDGGSGKKRARKPIKARSLKSLM